jgi:hypothetical protein
VAKQTESSATAGPWRHVGWGVDLLRRWSHRHFPSIRCSTRSGGRRWLLTDGTRGVFPSLVVEECGPNSEELTPKVNIQRSYLFTFYSIFSYFLKECHA